MFEWVLIVLMILAGPTWTAVSVIFISGDVVRGDKGVVALSAMPFLGVAVSIGGWIWLVVKIIGVIKA